MPLHLEELDPTTRQFMSAEVERELALPTPFVPERLTPEGRSAWPDLVRDAVTRGDDTTLHRSLLANPGLIVTSEPWARGVRKVNHAQASELIALSEFNTWYVRGLSARLLDEGVEQVTVYRAAEARWAHGDCERHEGLVVATQVVYDGHRARYWPAEDPSAFSVPFGPGCHHSIRR